jgi:hypothetical protein
MPHFDKSGFSDWKALSKYRRDANGYVIF